MSLGRNTRALRNRHFVLIDVICIICSAIISFAIRFETLNLRPELSGVIAYTILALLLKPPIFLAAGMYMRYWINAGASELLLSAMACAVTGAVMTGVVLVGSVIMPPAQWPIPRSIPLIDALLMGALVIGNRFSLRAYYHLLSRRKLHQPATIRSAKRTLIIGAGYSGTLVLNAIERDPDQMAAIGFLDDDPLKIGTYVRGTRVLGRLADLPEIVKAHRVQIVVIAMPSAPGTVIRNITLACQGLGVEYRTIPALSGLLNGKVTISALRRVEIDDLLRRAPIQLDTADIDVRLRGRCVMITGAGGSIGAELTMQIAACAPSRLLLAGHGENSLFAVEQKLKGEFCDLPYTLLLADVRDAHRMANIFAEWKPQVVFHAAAHKHVPMLEGNVSEAIANNVISTAVLIDLCEQYDVERMVLISTDKAVKPTNVMGMSKRVAELLMMNAARKHPGRFAAVRFGNVLGSRGSVIPIFERQIAAGGPLTITDAQMTRYFMSIPEATLLVLKASALCGVGSLFVLNMGDPVRIVDMAHDIIRLSGLIPERDIKITTVGMRPGEKMHEELFWDYETHVPVEGGAIFSVQLSDAHYERLLADVPSRVEALIRAARAYDEAAVRQQMQALVFTQPATERTNGKVLEGNEREPSAHH